MPEFVVAAIPRDTELLRRILGGDDPPMEMVEFRGESSSQRHPCTMARSVTRKYPDRDVLVYECSDHASQKTTKLYRPEYLKTAYAYRIPCSRWAKCANPDGPVAAHYQNPSKNPRRAGLPVCAHCRRESGPTSLARETLAERNRCRNKPSVRVDSSG